MAEVPWQYKALCSAITEPMDRIVVANWAIEGVVEATAWPPVPGRRQIAVHPEDWAVIRSFIGGPIPAFQCVPVVASVGIGGQTNGE